MLTIDDQPLLDPVEPVRHARTERRRGLVGGAREFGQRALERVRRVVEPRPRLRELLVEAGTRVRRDGVADDGGVTASSRHRGLGRVVERVEIEMRERPEQLVGPAVPGQRGLQTRHPLRRAVHADMDDRIGLEAVLEPGVERRELVMRREGLLEQQPHRITRHAHRRLQSDGDVAALERIDADRLAARRRDVAGRLAPVALDALGRAAAREPATEVAHRDAAPALAALQRTDPLVELRDLRRRAADGVALAAQALEERGHRCRHIEQRGGARLAEPRREVVQHDGHALLRGGRTPQPYPALDLVERTCDAVGRRHELAVADRAERHRARHPVHLRQVVHHHRLHRVRAAGVPLVLLLHQQRLRDEIRHVELAEQVRRGLVVVAGLGRGRRSADDREAHGRDEGVDRLVGEPLAHRDMRLDARHEHRQHRHAARLDAGGELTEVIETLDHVFAHAEQRDQRLTLAVAALLRRPLQVGAAVGEQLTARRIEAAHGRDHGHRRDLEARRTAAVAQDELDHLRDVRGVGLVPVEVHAEPGAEARELLRDERQHLRSHLHELGVRVERVLVAAAGHEPHQQLDGLRGLALLLLEAMLADLRQRHHLGHALVGEHRHGPRTGELRGQPVRLRPHVDQADEDHVGVGEIRRERGVAAIDMRVVVPAQAHRDALRREPPLDLAPGPGVEALDAHHERDRLHAAPHPPPER